MNADLRQRVIAAAIEHAVIPPDPSTGLRTNSPLYDLIPQGKPVGDEMLAIVEDITGKPVPRDIPGYLAPRTRAWLTRWAVREHHEDVLRMRGDLVARRLWKEMHA